MQRDSGLALIVGGTAHAGWKRVRVQRSMAACASSFEVEYSQQADSAGRPRLIQGGQACELRIHGEPVITGYVDQVQARLSAKTFELAVGGRDKTADLVDCAAQGGSGQWRGLRVETIAEQLAQPFGVNVRVEADTGKPLASFALQAGESAFEAMERAARMRGLLLTTNGRGDLVIARAGQDRVSGVLAVGVNVLAMRAQEDLRDRYSAYTVLGQSPGSDDWNGRAAAQVRAQAADPDVKRYRPLVVVNAAPDVAGSLAERALWEASTRAARSFELEVTVRGWMHADGLWVPNRLVSVRAPMLGVPEQDLLVAQVEYSLDDGGEVCRLGLTGPGAYTVQRLKEAAPGAAAGAYFRTPQAEANR